MNFRHSVSPLWGPDSGSGSGSGGGSTPSSAPSSPSSSSPSPSSATPDAGGGETFSSDAASDGGEAAGQDFSFIFGSDAGEGGEESGGLAPSEAPVVETLKPPAAPAAEAQKAAPKAEVVKEPETPVPTEVASSPPRGNLDPFDPGALALALQANEGAAIQHVADTLFKLSPEEIEALENDTVSAIPRLLAKGMVKGQLNMLQQLSRMIPSMIQRHGEVTQRHAQNESKFYARWPDLKPEVHGPLVLKYGAVYRQMHPEASLDSMIEELGPMVMMAAKVVPTLNGNGAQAVPSARSARGRPQPSPFTPAGAVAAGAIPQQAQEMSPIEAMFLGDND